MRTHLAIPFALALAFLTAAMPAAASDAQVGHNPPFQEFDAPSAADAPVPASPAAAPSPSVQPAAAPDGAARPSAPSPEPGDVLKRIVAFLTPSKEDLEKTLDAIVAPKDEPNSRPGPHWQTAARGRFQ